MLKLMTLLYSRKTSYCWLCG